MSCGSGCAGCNQCGDVVFPEGPAGIDGLNSFTITTADFVVPSVGSSVVIDVSNVGQLTGSWGKPGEVVYIENAGWYDLDSNTDTTITVTNPALYTAENAALAAVASTVAFPVAIGPSGPKGATGAAGSASTVAGPAGPTGGTIIETDVSETTTLQTTFAAANKTTEIPADTFEENEEVVEIDFKTVIESTATTGGLQMKIGAIGGVGGTTISLEGNFVDLYYTGVSSNDGVNMIEGKVRLVRTDTDKLRPIVEISGIPNADYAANYGNESKSWNIALRSPEVSGLDFTNIFEVELFMLSASGVGSNKLFYWQVTSFKK